VAAAITLARAGFGDGVVVLEQIHRALPGFRHRLGILAVAYYHQGRYADACMEGALARCA
jgi:hypothetical protein